MFYFYKILQRSLFPINFRVNLVRSILKIMDQKVPPGERVGAAFCPQSCYQIKNKKKKKTFSFRTLRTFAKHLCNSKKKNYRQRAKKSIKKPQRAKMENIQTSPKAYKKQKAMDSHKNYTSFVSREQSTFLKQPAKRKEPI